MFIFPSISHKHDNHGKNSYKIRLQRTKYLYWFRYALKEDARDSRKIAEQLAASSLVGIHIPNIEIEGDRALIRFRKTLTKEIARNKIRVKSFLYYHGIDIPACFTRYSCWSRRFITWLEDLE